MILTHVVREILWAASQAFRHTSFPFARNVYCLLPFKANQKKALEQNNCRNPVNKLSTPKKRQNIFVLT